jgi:hypothetical protein
MANLRLGFAACIILITLSVHDNLAFAGDQPNYGGKYSLKSRHPKPDADIEVVQTANSVDVTTAENGNRTTNHYPLDGSQADCARPGAEQVKCAAHFKGNELVLEQTFLTRTELADATRVHREEHWHLSADKKKLRIAGHFEFLRPPTIRGIIDPKDYTRIDDHWISPL